MYVLLITLGSFGLILVLARLKVPLSAAILLGAVSIGLLLGLTPIQVLQNAAEGLMHPRTIGLIVIVTCLMALSGTMQAGGQIRRIVFLTRTLVRRPMATLAALPALIGLLPMPGGALFSAPMVESAAANENLPSEKLSAINYWFRHVWEYWWPLYPGVILAITVTGSELASFVAFQLPLSIFMIASGLLIFRNVRPKSRISAPYPPQGTKRTLLKATSPIWLVLIVWLIVKLVLTAVAGKPPRGLPGGLPDAWTQATYAAVYSYLPIVFGLLVSLIWSSYLGRLDTAAIRKVWAKGRIYKMAVLVGSVMIFQHMLGCVDAPKRIGEELIRLNVPVLAVVAILPFIAGLVTGIAVGFVGTSFPIVLGLIGNAAEFGPIAPYVVLAYVFGHMGQMLSPLHLCYILSNRYFKTSFASVYAQIAPAVLVNACLAVGYFAVLKLVMN